MTLTIDVPDDVADWVVSLAETDRRKINEAAATVFAAALRSAETDSNESEDLGRPSETFENLVARLRAVRQRRSAVSEEQAEIDAVIVEAAKSYSAGERGISVSEAFSDIRGRLTKN